MQIELNAVTKGEHVPEIERLNRTIKERVRSIYNELKRHFTKVPGVLIREMVYATTFWLNSFPAADGISDTLSPRAMLTGTKLHFSRHCLLEFGEYVHTHEDGDNSMERWRVAPWRL